MIISFWGKRISCCKGQGAAGRARHFPTRCSPASDDVPKEKDSKGRSKLYHTGSWQQHNHSCIKCKFNLGDEGRCHVVGGKINNEKGISKFFLPKGDGMLPGDIIWMYVKGAGRKLKYKEGYVIKEGAQGFQCKDCKYYLYILATVC